MNTPNVFLHEATALARALAMTTALLMSSLGLAAPAHGAAPASPATARPATARPAAADVAGTTCINFEDLIVGTIYPIHSGFTSNGTSITVKPLDYFTASPVAGGQSEVENANRAGGGGKNIGLSDADLNISYTVPISGLSILYGDYGVGVGSRVNLVINNLSTAGVHIRDFDGVVRGGVTVHVYEDLNGHTGRIVLSGDVAHIAIGGTDLAVDAICNLPPPLPRTAFDLGDAPDSDNNHPGVAVNTAYPGVPGRFPTVWDGTPAGAGTGPRHDLSSDVVFLGFGVSGENEADRGPDQDGVHNILEGGLDTSNSDTRDDGWLNPLTRMNHCQTTILKVRVSRGFNPPATPIFLNAWFDGNRDGDWADSDVCADGSSNAEWIIQNQLINVSAITPGSYEDFSIVTRQVFNLTQGQPHWLRFTLAGIQSLAATSAVPDGRGPDAPQFYEYGETEDYKQDLAEAPFPGTLTLTKSALLPANPHGGDPVIYRIDLEHVGGSAPAITTLRDRLPEEVSFVGPISVTAITGTVSPLNATFISNTVQWSGELEPGAKLRLIIPARINPCVGADKTITNVARAENTDGSLIRDDRVFTVGCSPPPNVDVNKRILRLGPTGAVVADTEASVLPNDDIVFRFTARNNGTETASVFVRDEMPVGLETAGSNPLVGKGRLEVQPGLTATLDIRARVTAPCGIGRVITNVAQYVAVPGTAVQVSAFDLPPTLPRNPTNEVTLRLHCNELGDAPDSTNHFGVAMAAYPAVQANFPTVFDPATGADQGPLHRNSNPFHLGVGFSIEADADVLVDQDGVRNLVPLANNPNNDVFDDGTLMSRITFSDCATTTIPVRVLIGPNAAAFFAAHVGNGQGYLNVWVDGNRDGDWADVRECVTPNGSRPAFEHIVIDQQISLAALGAGLHTINVPTGRAPWPSASADKPSWLRVTLSELPSNKTLVLNGVPYGDGRGFAVPFVTGETEDYLWRAPNDTANGPDVTIRKRGAMRIDSGGPVISGTATSTDHVVWQIQYANLGTVDATGVQVVDDLNQAGNKAGLNITTVPPVSYTLSGNALTFNVGTLPAGASGNIMVELSRQLAQRIYTNTASITATNDIDAGNNTDQAEVKHKFLSPPLLLNPLDGTTCDGDFTGVNTLLGITTEGAMVDVYVDGVLTATVPAGGSGYFRHDMVLPDGEHTLYAVAHLNGHDSVGESRTVIVNRALTWDPLSLRFIDSLNRRFRPVDADGRTDETGWVPHLTANTVYTVSVRVCCESPIASVSLNVSGTLIALTDPDGDQVFQAVYTTPGTSITSIPFGLTVDCNGATSQVPANVLIDPAGVVYDSATGAKLGNAAVVCMAQDPSDATNYSVWPAADFGQTNPFITQADGAFSFLTPPGTYRLDVSRSGYQPYRSPNLQVVDVPVHFDVPLSPAIAEPAAMTITVGSNGYTPAVAKAVPGTVIAFVNVDVQGHRVKRQRVDGTAAGIQSLDQTGGFDSGELGPNQSYKIKLGTSGTLIYNDGANLELAGVIQVVGVEGGHRVLMPVIQR